MKQHKKLGFWLRAAASITLLWLCVRLFDSSTLWDAIKDISIAHFTLAFAFSAMGTVLVRAWIAHQTTRASGLDLSWASLVRINLVARFYTIVLPRGASAVVRWHHYRSGGSGQAAAALLTFENLVSIATLFLSAAILLPWNSPGDSSYYMPWLSIVSIAGSVFTVLLLLPFLHGPSGALAIRFLASILGRFPRVATPAKKFMTAISVYKNISGRTISSIFAASLVGYGLFVLSAWALGEGMQLGVGLLSMAWIRSITLLIALIPITVAGLGLREASFISLLGQFGVTPAAAFAFAMSTFAIQLVLGAAGAALEVQRLLRGSNDMPAKHPKKADS